MDDDRLWLKAKYGLPPDFNQCPREIAFCATTVCGTEMVVASDLRQDARFREIPFVTGEPHFQFYCGVPLVTVEGYALGTLCVMDFEPRQLTFQQTESLRRLSHQVMTQLELHRRLIEFDQAVKELDAWPGRISPRKRQEPRNCSSISCPWQSPRKPEGWQGAAEICAFGDDTIRGLQGLHPID